MNIHELLEEWAGVNSYSYNRPGLEKMVSLAREAFSQLHPDEIVTLPFGLSLKKRAKAPLQIFLGGHLDTVFPPDHPFQSVTRLDSERLQGPGVADMKGGVLVMLQALLEFETSPEAQEVGWEVFLNTDEEIGSPHSTPFLQECAGRCSYALLFEPTLSNGTLVSGRRGSSNYHLVSKGKAAHAGRAALGGKNAIFPLARFISELEALNDGDTLVNVGIVKGGNAYNIVPDHAEAGLNVRSHQDLTHLLEKKGRAWGVSVTRLTYRPPKPFDRKTEKLFELLKECGKKLKVEIKWEESGGVCDGNTFGAAGIPTIDTLGVEGGGLHSEHEFVYLPSLEAKAKLTTLLIKELARKHS